MKSHAFWGAALLLAFASVVPAQTVTSSLLGTVNDPTGSPVPNAQIELTSQTTGEIMTTATNSDGIFRFPIVPAGSYQPTVKANGFKTYNQAGIALSTSDNRDLGRIALELGSLQESVIVEATTTPVQTASSEKSALVTGQELNDIALKGRDFFGLMYTLPGVVDTSTTRDATSPNAIGSIYIAGGRSNTKNFTVDGLIDIDTGSNGTLHYEPNIDAIAEARVLTSNYQAEFGRSGGGTISIITKGGGQDFHGSAWWQHRNEDMNANLWNNNRNGLVKAPYRLGIEGFTIGGPIYIPHHFNSDKRKLFFFFSQEYTGQKINNSPVTGNMPTAAERNGDFSKSYDTNGSLIVITDPSTGKPFPNNIVPSTRINPVGQAVLNFFPMPNYPTSDPSLIYQENYAAIPVGTHTRRNDVVRVDYNITSKLMAYFRWINDKDDTTQNYHDLTNFVGPGQSHPNPGHGYAGHLLWTISPTLVNETTIGKSFNTWDWYVQDPAQWDRARMGNIPKWYPIDLSLGDQANYIPDVSFGGTPVNTPGTSPNSDIPYYNANNVYSATDNISKVWGRHSFKAGLYFERTQKIEDQEVSYWLGSYNFSTDANNPFERAGSFFIGAFLLSAGRRHFVWLTGYPFPVSD